VVSTHASTSQADGLNSDSVFSFSVTTPNTGYSNNSEWILDTRATYHVYPNRDWCSSFEKLDGCYTVIGDNHLCNVKGIGTIHIKMFDGIVRELKEVRHVPQLKRNLISGGVLETLGHGIHTRWCSQDDQRLNGGYEGRPLEQSLLLEG